MGRHPKRQRRGCFHLAGVLVLAAIVAPESYAKGAAPKPDFSIGTHEKAYLWGGTIVGTWQMHGVDSGIVSGAVGFPYSWLLLDGEFGSIEIRTRIDPQTYEKTFEIMEGSTGLYETWVGGGGSWDYKSGRAGKNKDYWNSSRTLSGFLP